MMAITKSNMSYVSRKQQQSVKAQTCNLSVISGQAAQITTSLISHREMEGGGQCTPAGCPSPCRCTYSNTGLSAHVVL